MQRLVVDICICYEWRSGSSLSFVNDVSNQYPSVQFVLCEHNEKMKNECDLFLMQLNK